MNAPNLKPLLLPGLTAVVFSALPTMAWAQWGIHGDPEAKPPVDESVSFQKIGVSGPRFGVTYVPGNSTLMKRLEEEGMDPILSQFGWHFERRVLPDGGGPEFVLQAVPLVAGVEYGKLLPSLPVNLAFTTNPDGNRVALLFGYAIRK